VMHGATGGLLAVAEGGVEEENLIGSRHKVYVLSIWTLS
jgi:hypothetical protein